MRGLKAYRSSGTTLAVVLVLANLCRVRPNLPASRIQTKADANLTNDFLRRAANVYNDSVTRLL